MKRIYYFSGTGNSLRAAQQIAEEIGDTEIVSMRCKPEDVPATECDVIGFIYPVYHWTMPDPVENFIRQLLINTKAYIFVVAMPSFVVGYACEKLEQILSKKGIYISYGTKVNCVANYVVSYSPKPSPNWVVPRTEKKLTVIAKEVKAKVKRDIPRTNFIIKNRYPKIMPGYRSLQKFADYAFTISNECVSCGLCSKVCPCGNIEMDDGKPIFLHNCSQCMACVAFCPKRAVGYDLSQLSPENMEQVKCLPQGVAFVEKMGLPDDRKIYRNPYVKTVDLMKNTFYIEGRNQ